MVGTGALREKTIAFSVSALVVNLHPTDRVVIMQLLGHQTGIDVIVGFVDVFTTPFLLAILRPKLGYVWMAFTLL